MAKKKGSRAIYKETDNKNGKYESCFDEITLRDEILKLKRQVLILRRTNEQYLVKLRKYEDESKRKDKHFEQLMDPRKNSDITKVLSTKGAAILMNLKDQNNALIQMILNKDLHIRRLAAEIKMSKLYASKRKNESYRAEITRLRNLLIKSQETLKENVDVQKQAKSICVSGNSFLEFSSSSDQSSPRDLDELRFTILNLESHIKYSNDLLTKKNQEISLLTDELNFYRKFFRYKTSNKTLLDFDFPDRKNHGHSTGNLTSSPVRIISTKLSSQDILDVFEKDIHCENENIPYSAPAALPKWLPTEDSIPDYDFQSQNPGQRTENVTESNSEPPVGLTTTQNDFKEVDKSISELGKSVFHIIAADEIKKEEKMLSNSNETAHTKQKWKKAFEKFKELKKSKTEMTESCENVENIYRETCEKQDLKKTEKETQNYQILEENESKSVVSVCENIVSSESLNAETNENRSRPPTTSSESDNGTCRSSDKNSTVLFKEVVKDETHQNDKETRNSELQLSSSSETEFSRTLEEINSKSRKSLREIYRQSLDSSFDSENSFSMKQQVQHLQIEAQINSHNFGDETENSFLEYNLIFKAGRENGESSNPDQDFNDDDDVIVREK